MIARTWSATTTQDPTRYRGHFREDVVPRLETIAGFRGCYLLEDVVDGGTRFTAFTLWESEEHVRAFAGDDVRRAHVEPEGRAALTEFDEWVRHYEVTVARGPALAL